MRSLSWIAAVFVALLGLPVWPPHAQGQGPVSRAGADIVLFTRAGCPHCEAAKAYLAELQRRRPGLKVEVHDVARDPAALARLRELAAGQRVRVPAVPAFRVGGELVVGFGSRETTGRRIEALLARPPPGPVDVGQTDSAPGENGTSG